MKFKELKGILASDEMCIYLNNKFEVSVISDESDNYINPKTGECVYINYGECDVEFIYDLHYGTAIQLKN